MTYKRLRHLRNLFIYDKVDNNDFAEYFEHIVKRKIPVNFNKFDVYKEIISDKTDVLIKRG